MEFHQLLTIFTYLSLLLVASHANAALSPEAYWKATLPNTPMPKAVKVLVSHELTKDDTDTDSSTNAGTPFPIYINVTVSAFSYSYGGTLNLSLFDAPVPDVFFLENSLIKPKNVTLDFTQNHDTTTLLPRLESQKIPFSSEKVQEILDHFSVKQNSSEAMVIQETIARCEEPRAKGEDKYCATSLESMIDFVTSELGKNVMALSTDVERKTRVQEYSIISVKKLAENEVAVCHKLNYAYVVFDCHKTSTARAYMVSVVGVDGTRAKVAAVCHTDTSGWNPNHPAFQVLKVKPGSVPICHFLPEGHVVWVPKY